MDYKKIAETIVDKAIEKGICAAQVKGLQRRRLQTLRTTLYRQKYLLTQRHPDIGNRLFITKQGDELIAVLMPKWQHEAIKQAIDLYKLEQKNSEIKYYNNIQKSCIVSLLRAHGITPVVLEDTIALSPVTELTTKTKEIEWTEQK